MRESNFVHNYFPLSTPYFTVLPNGTAINTTPTITPWFAGLGIDQNQGVVFIEHNHPSNGFVVKSGPNAAAIVMVPMTYLFRMQAAGGSLTIAGPLTGAYSIPLPSATQNIFAFKNGILQATVPAKIPVSTSDTWAILVTNDKLSATAAPYSATLAATPLTGTHGSTLITFTLTEQNKPAGSSSYTWNFGDGSAATVTSTPTTTYTYPAAGSFTATCTPTINGVTESVVTAAAPAVIS